MYKKLRYISPKRIICLSLTILMGCFFLLGCSSEKEKDGRYKSISDIKGAKVVENPEKIFYIDGFADLGQPDNFLEMYLKTTDDAICVGELINPIAVEYKIPAPIWQPRHASLYDTGPWQISTFDIKIADPVRNLEGKDVIKVAAVSHFYEDRVIDMDEFGTYGERYSEKSKGLFILRRITDEHKWSIGDGYNEIKLGDYADFFLFFYFKTDGVEFNYFDLGIIQIDDFRDKNLNLQMNE